MTIRIICVGRLKEKYLQAAVAEYSKRLSAYCRLEVIEVKDEKITEAFSPAEKERAVAAEGERILKHLRPGSLVVCLKIDGKQMTSEAFAENINQLALSGKSDLTFIIGGSLGLSKDVQKQSKWDLSFSKMTFPHQLFRVILLEQIYRSFKIIRNETYHK